MLEGAGYQVDVAADGATAADMAAAFAYDAVLMDMQMPVMDGLAMSMEIRELTADLAELRADSEPEGMTLNGYGARFNSRSEDMGFRETIEPVARSVFNLA